MNIDFDQTHIRKPPNNLYSGGTFLRPSVDAKEFQDRKVSYIIIHDLLEKLPEFLMNPLMV